MRERVLIDTGPLVAYFSIREASHEWLKQEMARLRPPLFTSEAVIAETCHLLHKRAPESVSRLERWFKQDLLRVPFDFNTSWPRTFELMHAYRNLPMSLADASLVAMVESGMGDRVFTLDEHFRVYRHSGRRVVPVLMPG